MAVSYDPKTDYWSLVELTNDDCFSYGNRLHLTLLSWDLASRFQEFFMVCLIVY